METILARRELHIERKYLIIELRQNERGRYLKICETAAGRRNLVIVPDSGLADFSGALASVLGANPAAEQCASVSPEGAIGGGAQSDACSSSLRAIPPQTNHSNLDGAHK